MKSQCVVILISSLLVSSCAFRDGLKNSQDQASDGSNKQSKTITAPAPAISPVNTNSPNAQAATAIAPLTH